MRGNLLGHEKMMEREKEMEEGEKSIRGNLWWKCILFVLATVSLTLMGGCLYFTFYLTDSGYFDTNRDNFIRSELRRQIWQDYYQWCDADLDLNHMEYIASVYGEEVGLELWDTKSGEVVWSNGTEFEPLYTYTIYTDYYRSIDGEGALDSRLWRDIHNSYTSGYYLNLSGEWVEEAKVQEPEETESIIRQFEQREYCWVYMISPQAYDVQGKYGRTLAMAEWLYADGDMILLLLGISAAVFLVSVFLLMLCVGHQNKKPGITPSCFGRIPMDLFGAGYVVLAYMGAYMIWGVFIQGAEYYSLQSEMIPIAVFAVMESGLGVIFLSECVNRLKSNTFIKSMLIYRFLSRLAGFIKEAFRRMKTSVSILVGFLLLAGIEFLVILYSVNQYSFQFLVFMWAFEKLLFLVGIGIFMGSFEKIQTGAGELAGGNFNYKIDTQKMIAGFSMVGENLNHIADGMNTAVEERLKSERLKTELITNVSHDLKTPLTSIINYSDLIANIGDEKEKLKEYAGVLNRQSIRLKKLLEDLLEASKAATGNIEVNLQACDIGVMLTQTVGEYEDKFREKGLILVEKRPENPLWIKADGRHLWRIFDNLMNNIYKYAMENSRVYINLEKQAGNAVVTFRNMSKYELDVSSTELTERFVRGDKSRNIEGNGLGLSIASSLTTIQNGEIKIAVDGDLFKVILSFPVCK